MSSSRTKGVDVNLYATYFSELCSNNVELKAESVVDGKEYDTFYRIDYWDVQTDLRDRVANKFLMLELADGQLTDNGGDHFKDQLNAAFIIYVKCEDNSDDDQKQIALDQAKNLAFKFLVKLRSDAKNPDHWLYRKFKLSEVRYQKAGPDFDHYYGFRCEFPLAAQLNVKYNPSDWIS